MHRLALINEKTTHAYNNNITTTTTTTTNGLGDVVIFDAPSVRTHATASTRQRHSHDMNDNNDNKNDNDGNDNNNGRLNNDDKHRTNKQNK